jgi:hypothetical protein
MPVLFRIWMDQSPSKQRLGLPYSLCRPNCRGPMKFHRYRTPFFRNSLLESPVSSDNRISLKRSEIRYILEAYTLMREVRASFRDIGQCYSHESKVKLGSPLPIHLHHMPKSVEVLWKTVSKSHLRQKSGKQIIILDNLVIYRLNIIETDFILG